MAVGRSAEPYRYSYAAGCRLIVGSARPELRSNAVQMARRSGGLNYPPRKDGRGIRRLNLLAIASVI